MSELTKAIDSLDIERLKFRVGEKWNTYPPDVLPAWVAEMDYPLAEPIREILAQALEHDDLGYPINLRSIGVPKAFSQRMADRYGWETNPRRADVITDIVQGIYVAIDVLSEPGDGVIVQTPIYPPFLNAVADTKRRLVENRMIAGPDGWEIDFDGLRAGIDARTRILLLCNPHNPTGRVFRRDELEQLAQIACENDLVVVADEVHGDLVFDDRKHIPIASLSEEIGARTITLTSATKAFNIPGLRCGVAHFGSEDLQSRYRSIPRHLRGGVGLLGLYATLAAWQRSQPWLDEVRSYLQRNRDDVADFVSTRLPNIVHTPNESTYLAWLDCSAVDVTGSPSAHILENQRLALNDGRHFGKGFEKFVRLNFATSRRILGEILERLEKATQASQR